MTRKYLTRRANQWHQSIIAQSVRRPWALPNDRRFGAMTRKTFRQLKLHRLAAASDRRRVTERPACGRWFERALHAGSAMVTTPADQFRTEPYATGDPWLSRDAAGSR